MRHPAIQILSYLIVVYINFTDEENDVSFTCVRDTNKLPSIHQF